MNDHERGFLSFLAEPSKRRLETLLELGERRRRDVRELLHHSIRLDPRFARHLTGSDRFSGSVEAMLDKRGAPSICYVLAGDSELDGREMPLGDAFGRSHRHGCRCVRVVHPRSARLLRI